MTVELFVLISLALAAIGALPIVFFRGDRELNIRWWLTAMPFFIAAGAIAGAFLGLVPVWRLHYALAVSVAIAAVIAAAGSIALLFYTLGTHRRPIALWHQANDGPIEIVTWGAYARIRHPFYSAFALALAAALLAAPSVATLGCFVWGVAALSLTAWREERRLLVSRYGADYRAYMGHTGRFLPRLGSGRHA